MARVKRDSCPGGVSVIQDQECLRFSTLWLSPPSPDKAEILALHALLTLTVNTLVTLDTAFQIGYPSPDDSSFPVKLQKGLL